MTNDVVVFKGNKEGLVVRCNDEAEWEDIFDTLKERLEGKGKSFFAGAGVVFEAEGRVLTPEQVGSLWRLFQENGLKVKAIRTGEGKGQHRQMRISSRDEEGSKRSIDEVSDLPTLIVRRNIRSGQDVSFAGNVIVFGDTKPGSEVSASGYVLVMGKLSGTVHAGAAGDERAWVGAIRLQPTQLRIANYITRAPDEEPTGPEIAHICEGAVIVRDMKKIGNYIEINRRN